MTLDETWIDCAKSCGMLLSVMLILILQIVFASYYLENALSFDLNQIGI